MVHHVYQAQSQTGRLINAKSPVNDTKPPCLSWFRLGRGAGQELCSDSVAGAA